MITCKPQGVCASAISFELRGTRVFNVQFSDGCSGNLQGIARLVEGLPAAEIIRKLRGIACGGKPTSCPDQLATAIAQVCGGNADRSDAEP